MNGKGKLLTVPIRRSESDPTPEQRGERQTADLARIGRFIGRMQESRYYGKITVTLVDGRLTEIRTEQVLKVGDLG